MQDQILSEAEINDEILVTPNSYKIAGAFALYAIILTIGTAICIWFVDFRAKGTFSTIRGENVTQQGS